MTASADNTALRLVVVGLGRFGRLHAQTIRGLPEADLAALVDPNPDAAPTGDDCLAGVPFFDNLAVAMAETEADGWIIASSTPTHIRVAQELLDAGKTVLLEKPISDNLADAQALGALVHDDSSNLMMGHIVLFNSEFRQLLKEVENRPPVRYINSVRYRPTDHIHEFPGESPFDLLMVHDLYMTMALVGAADPIRFNAQSARNKDGVCDLAVAQLQWEDGTLAVLAASYLTPGGMPPVGVDRLEVYGEGWAAQVDSNPRPLQVWDERARWPMALEISDDPIAPAGMLAEELRCFCRVLRGQQAVPAGARYADALRILRWLQELAVHPG